MSLDMRAVSLIAPYLKDARVLCLGYPDLALTDDEAERVFGKRPTKHLFRKFAHTRSDKPFPETAEMFLTVAKEFRCLDMDRFTGCEEVCDLNLPQTIAKADLVIDAGTLEHCFNVGQALMNVAAAVEVGGRIIHINPMTMVNHGFWNFSPTLYADFYGQNGWIVEKLEAWGKQDGKLATGALMNEPWSRKLWPAEFGVIAVAKRQHDAPLQYPVQQKYAAASFDSRRAA